MNMYEKLQRAHGTLMVVNDRSDFDLEPVCKLLKEAADRIAALEAVMHYVAVMLIGCEDEDKYLRKMVLAVLEEQGDE